MSDDSISRRAALDTLKKISFSQWFECGEYLSEDIMKIKIINSNKALEAIEALPAVEPERKKGQWVNDGKGLYKCTSCGELWLHWWAVVVPPDKMYENLRYCPHCGAEMRGEEE